MQPREDATKLGKPSGRRMSLAAALYLYLAVAEMPEML